jgi:predicted DCC family thiol-disulfide oxidoreductase YuxK
MDSGYDVFYDGSCPLCRAEIDALSAANVGGVLRLHDCSPAAFSDPRALAEGIDRAAMMLAMHVRDPQGRWHAGVDAFVVMYRAIGIESIARLWGHAWLKPLWVRLYPWIARNRLLLSRLGVTRPFEALVRTLARRAARRRCVDGGCRID